MPTSAFGTKAQELGGVIRAEDVTLDFPGNKAGSGGALVQQAQLTCERTVNMIYEIGSSQVYYVGDRRRGTAQFNRVVGGSSTFGTMVSTFGDLCKAKTNNMTMKVGSSSCASTGAGGVTYTMYAVTLNSIGASVSAQDIVVTESMGFMFVDLDHKVG